MIWEAHCQILISSEQERGVFEFVSISHYWFIVWYILSLTIPVPFAANAGALAIQKFSEVKEHELMTPAVKKQ